MIELSDHVLLLAALIACMATIFLGIFLRRAWLNWIAVVAGAVVLWLPLLSLLAALGEPSPFAPTGKYRLLSSKYIEDKEQLYLFVDTLGRDYTPRVLLGEDSGIVVDALDGRPGVYSARYSGPDATDASNNQLLLEELGSTPNEKREAHYVCHVSLADPSGAVRVDCEEYCRGRIGKSEAGANGFGYDPLFEIVEYHRTFGELSEAVKSVLSHRARALRRIVPKLLTIASAGKWVRNDR